MTTPKFPTPSTLDALIAAGHATRTRGEIVGPVTTGGHYRTTDGWVVAVEWQGGLHHVDPVGYSAEYGAARAEVLDERQWHPEEEAELDAAVLARLTDSGPFGRIVWAAD